MFNVKIIKLNQSDFEFIQERIAETSKYEDGIEISRKRGIFYKNSSKRIKVIYRDGDVGQNSGLVLPIRVGWYALLVSTKKRCWMINYIGYPMYFWLSYLGSWVFFLLNGSFIDNIIHLIMIQLFTGLFLYGGLKDYEEVSQYSKSVLDFIKKDDL